MTFSSTLKLIMILTLSFPAFKLPGSAFVGRELPKGFLALILLGQVLLSLSFRLGLLSVS